jgi:hypothetical protein
MATNLSAWTTNPYLQAASGGTTAPTNPFTTVSNTKSTDVETRLKSLFDMFDANNKSGAGAIADYAAAVKKATPTVEAQTGEDLGAIGDLFSGKAAGDLAGIRARRKAAMAGVAKRSLGDLSRVLGSTQLAIGGGGRGLGLGSFLTKLGLDKSADIESKAAMDDATAERADFEDILNRRLAATGTRQRLTDTLAGRNLLPYQAENERFSSTSGMLNALLQQELANKFFGLRGETDAFAT